MSKMVEGIRTTGKLRLEPEEGEEYESFKLYDKTEWLGIKCPISIRVDELLSKFEGKTIEIRIDVVEE